MVGVVLVEVVVAVIKSIPRRKVTRNAVRKVTRKAADQRGASAATHTSIYSALALATSGLLAGSIGCVGVAGTAHAAKGDWLLDTAVLYYQENNSRLKAIEPVLSLKRDLGDDSFLGFNLSYTTLSGASPTGAVAQPTAQTFTTASSRSTISSAQSVATAATTAMSRKADKETDTKTAASGGGEDGEDGIKNPLACGQSSSGAYTTQANQLAGIPRFGDCRIALSTSYNTPLNETQKIQLGAAYSRENDYLSTSLNLTFSQDINQKLTTLSVGGNYEYDVSSPYGGTPVPLSVYNSGRVTPGNTTKHVTDILFGLAQVINAKWLVQANLSVGQSRGDHNDPYKVFSVVNPATGLLFSGDPNTSNYVEARPQTRQRNSIFTQSKWSVGRDVLDLSYRYYKDSWEIQAHTIEAQYRFVFDGFYLQPQYRWYRQTGASFYAPYRTSVPISGYASADYRLAPFHTQTMSVKWGVPLGLNREFGIQVGQYAQIGDVDTSQAPGYLQNRTLFQDLKSISLVLNYSLVF